MYKKKLMFLLGFILSPLSWWNDVFVNLPLAYVFAWPFSFVSDSVFSAVFIIFYWITNLSGMLLMHMSVDDSGGLGKRALLKNILVTVLYTAVLCLAISKGWLKSPAAYAK